MVIVMSEAKPEVKPEPKPNEELDALINELNNPPEQEQQQQLTELDMRDVIVTTAKAFSTMLSSMLNVPEAQLSEEDAKQLHAALEPFKDDLNKSVQYIKYLPLIMWVGNYGIRVTVGLQKRRQSRNFGYEWGRQNNTPSAPNTATARTENKGNSGGHGREPNATKEPNVSSGKEQLPT